MNPILEEKDSIKTIIEQITYLFVKRIDIQAQIIERKKTRSKETTTSLSLFMKCNRQMTT